MMPCRKIGLLQTSELKNSCYTEFQAYITPLIIIFTTKNSSALTTSEITYDMHFIIFFLFLLRTNTRTPYNPMTFSHIRTIHRNPIDKILWWISKNVRNNVCLLVFVCIQTALDIRCNYYNQNRAHIENGVEEQWEVMQVRKIHNPSLQ